MPNYRAIIVDDEKNSRDILENLINQYFDDIDIVASAENVQEGIEQIKRYSPDLLILDINLPDGTGFDILKETKDLKYKLVFVSAHDEYAIKAFKFSAIDYILKPIDISDFISAIESVKALLQKENSQVLIEELLSIQSNPLQKKKKIVLKTSTDVFLIPIEDIISCESEGSYTRFFVKGYDSILVSKNLREYEELLADQGFFRPHNSHLINLHEIHHFHKSQGGTVNMSNGSTIPVSVRKKERFLKIITKLGV